MVTAYQSGNKFCKMILANITEPEAFDLKFRPWLFTRSLYYSNISSIYQTPIRRGNIWGRSWQFGGPNFNIINSVSNFLYYIVIYLVALRSRDSDLRHHKYCPIWFDFILTWVNALLHKIINLGDCTLVEKDHFYSTCVNLNN